MSNLESVRGLYEAFAKGDVPTVLAFLDADIAWTDAEGFPYGGAYNGSFNANFAHVWKIREGKAVRFVQYVDTLLVHRALRHKDDQPSPTRSRLAFINS